MSDLIIQKSLPYYKNELYALKFSIQKQETIHILHNIHKMHLSDYVDGEADLCHFSLKQRGKRSLDKAHISEKSNTPEANGNTKCQVDLKFMIKICPQ